MNLDMPFVTQPDIMMVTLLGFESQTWKFKIKDFLKSCTVAMYNSIYLQKYSQHADK